MAIISIDTAAGNPAIRNGELAKVIGETLERFKPEAAYFGLKDGKRTMFMVFDMQDASQMPPLAEPFFMGLDAEISLEPVMNADDLRKGLGGLGTGG
ncbi:MAG TPA: hypothetical protein VK665_18435 [Candidatus Elarobacter sp.]|nr:hypothetical protein [Candidatus Elarobacter sp.]